ncbi:MAG: hypothetical protein COA94_02865 [Rickettsiales bacterium]|nr:MAG: hypothetical protein COA94_02865 [Rickettsiales bacterium]
MQFPAVSKKIHFSFSTAITALGISLILLAMPYLFYIEYLYGAAIWCSLLAFEEMFAPYIDYYAAKHNAILTKEVSISIGGGLSVFWMRYFHDPTILIMFSLLLLLLAHYILALRIRNSS